jgi:hypothetical protein
MAAMLYQANIHVGDFIGSMEWGVRGYNVHGHEVDKNKRTHAPQDGGYEISNGIVVGPVDPEDAGRRLPLDLGDAMDYLHVQEDMVEWTFYAHSIEAPLPGEPSESVWASYGQLDFVQFFLMQQSANIGTERGQVDTFEYQRNAYRGTESGTQITRNGVPMPMKTTRP